MFLTRPRICLSMSYIRQSATNHGQKYPDSVQAFWLLEFCLESGNDRQLSTQNFGVILCPGSVSLVDDFRTSQKIGAISASHSCPIRSPGQFAGSLPYVGESKSSGHADPQFPVFVR